MKIGICSEIFNGWELEKIFSFISMLHYDGLEIAPFKLGNSVEQISREERKGIKNLSEKHGVEIIGTHWLLVKPEGLSISTGNKEIRDRTSKYFVELVIFTQEIGGKIMVLGSPKQRNVDYEKQTYEEIKEYLKEVIEPALKEAEKRDVFICLEPLGKKETNFVNTASQAIKIIEEVNHPNFKLILDVKAMSDQEKPIPEIIQEGSQHLAHFHANDANLSGPGFGEVDFGPIVSTLKNIGYNNYLSVEVFDFSPGAEEIAKRSIEYLKKEM